LLSSFDHSKREILVLRPSWQKLAQQAHLGNDGHRDWLQRREHAQYLARRPVVLGRLGNLLEQRHRVHAVHELLVHDARIEVDVCLLLVRKNPTLFSSTHFRPRVDCLVCSTPTEQVVTAHTSHKPCKIEVDNACLVPRKGTDWLYEHAKTFLWRYDLSDFVIKCVYAFYNKNPMRA